MPAWRPDPKEMGRYFSLSQVGLEMVVPIGIGLAVDNYFGCQPWGVVVGAVVGLVGGFTHLLIQLKQLNNEESKRPPRNLP
jgi:F0F1-type ATP synthase assembly protein I